MGMLVNFTSHQPISANIVCALLSGGHGLSLNPCVRPELVQNILLNVVHFFLVRLRLFFGSPQLGHILAESIDRVSYDTFEGVFVFSWRPSC